MTSEAAPAAIAVGDTWYCDPAYQDGVCPITINAGETVTWNYPGGASSVHTVTDCGASCGSPTGSPLFDSRFMFPGASFSYRFDQEGTVNYYCTIHPNMRGVITVRAGVPVPTATPTPAPPPIPTPTAARTPAPAATATPAAEPVLTPSPTGPTLAPTATAAATSGATVTPSPRRTAPSRSPAATAARPSDGEASSGGGTEWSLLALAGVGLGLVPASVLAAAWWRRSRARG